MKWMLFSVLIIYVSCGTNYVQDVVTIEGTIIDIDSARFEFPDSAVMDSLIIEIEENSVPKKTYAQGYKTMGTAYSLEPFELGVEKPVKFTIPVRSPDCMLGAKIAQGFVPLANSYVDGETLRAQLWHGGEYYIIQKPERYGITHHADADSALLVVTDPYVSDYINRFEYTLSQHGYNYPVWIFVYDLKRSIEENAIFLTDELSRLHEQYGDFRLDIVSFGLGGLVFHRYVADTALYQRDVSSSVLAVGTPFKGTALSSIESATQSLSGYGYFYIDGLAARLEDIATESELIDWITQNRNIVGGHYYDDVHENKNFASIRGNAFFSYGLDEESAGDGLISLEAGMLTAIEPEPLALDHFGLYEDRTAYEYITDFTMLYRTFNWPMLFEKVWRDEASITTITKVWHEEARLHYRDTGVELLLQWNENMLRSTPPNALLITNGDNDTYPAWFLQEQGIRTDVTIVNRSLLNIKEYTMYLQKHKDLPLDLTPEELKELKFQKQGESYYTISDQILEILIDNGKRPLVFSTTVYNPEKYERPLRLAGVVYEIGESDIEVEGKFIDIERTWQLLKDTFEYDKFLATSTTSIPIRQMYRNYTGVLSILHMAFDMQEDKERAIEALEFAQTLCPDEETYTFINFNLALTYTKYGNNDIADSLFRAILKTPSASVTFKIRIAEVYHKLEQVEYAIRILADCLKIEPDNREILDLIKKYQEEL